MKTISLTLDSAAGRTLAATIYGTRDTTRKLYARGHTLSDSDITLLRDAGITSVACIEMGSDDMGELEAATAVSELLVCGYARLEIAPGGRINVVADADCCVIVDQNILYAVNSTEDVTVAALRHFSFAAAGTRIATVKSRPFSARARAIQEAVEVLKSHGPAIQARPIDSRVAVVYSDINDRYRARKLFGNVVSRKLSMCNIHRFESVETVEKNIAHALNTAFRQNPTLVLIASTTAPAGPEDLVGVGMRQMGVEFERFLAPVEPGNMMLLGYREEVPVLAAPTCWRSCSPNIVDLLLPALLARYGVSRAEISMLGHGGLLA